MHALHSILTSFQLFFYWTIIQIALEMCSLITDEVWVSLRLEKMVRLW